VLRPVIADKSPDDRLWQVVSDDCVHVTAP
jgi:hypothetical protein